MRTKVIVTLMLVLITILQVGSANPPAVSNQQPEVIQLEKPVFITGKLLMQALSERKSSREFSSRELSSAHLSGLLWSANGQSRADGKRTAPSAMNLQMVDIYVVLQGGIYLYNPANHQLVLVNTGDFRKLAGTQPFVAGAPVNLIFVADFAKWKSGNNEPTREDLVNSAGIEAGAQAQNAYLYCASEGLAVVIRGSVNKEELSKILKLTADQYIVAGQTVGYQK